MIRKVLLSLLLISICVLLNLNCESFAKDEINKSVKRISIDSPRILKEQAIISYQKGNYEEAIDYLESISPINRDEDILFLLSNCHDNMGNTQKASDYLNKAIELNPKNHLAYYNLGVLNFNQDNVNSAIEFFNNAIKLNKTFAPAYYNLGNCYYKLQNYKKALNLYNKAIKLDPYNANIYYNAGLTYEALKNTKNAEKYFSIYKKLSDYKINSSKLNER